MPASNSKGAYSDCFELFDRALEKGRIRVGYPTKGEAHQLLSRLQYCRVLDREESQRIYEADHPQWGTSAYDSLIVRIPREEEGKWWVYIEPRIITGQIEELAAE